jgi:hypothetical protein
LLGSIVVLVIIMVLGGIIPVNGAVAITIQDHGLAKKVVYTQNGHLAVFNRTSTFTQDDAEAFAFVKATFYSANLTWNWYDPTGELVQVGGWTANCVTSPCDEENSLPISGGWAERLGLWRVDFLADGTLIFSDYFSVMPIITQYNYWNFNVIQSSPPRVHGFLEVTLHPNNLTWRYYRIYMPYATNVTAYEASTNHPLHVTAFNDSRVVIDFGAPRSDGYMFILTFDLTYGLDSLGSGSFALTWRQYTWERFDDVHLVPERFSVSLPQGAAFLDVVGYNAMALSYTAGNSSGVIVDFARNETYQPFGWTVLYRDLSVASASNPGVGSLVSIMLPVLPLTLSDLSVWSAVMSVLMLTASELASPLYARSSSRFLLNRRRLRIAALLLVALFMVTTAYRLIATPALVR